MTDQEIRIAVTEELGWINTPDGWYDSINRRTFPWIGNHNLPDYCHDLNACAEMEKALTEEQWIDYQATLWGILDRDRETNPRSATARQRCEAFLRVRGKWRGDK